MGKNYYATTPPCPRCGREAETLHIGKSSAGWVFSLHVYPELGINNWTEWLSYLVGKVITDEYGREWELEELVEIVTERKRNNPNDKSSLLRSRIDGRHCVGHGEGTWDYIVGDFC